MLQAQFMVLTEPLPYRLKDHRHQLPSAPKAGSQGSTAAAMPNVELSLLLSAFGQALKFQLLG